MGELHRVPETPDVPLEENVRLLRILVAQLWDEVWWHQLPFWRRWYYWLQGFRSPISEFYTKEPD